MSTPCKVIMTNEVENLGIKWMCFAQNKLVLRQNKVPCPFPQSISGQFFSLCTSVPPPWSLQEPHSPPFNSCHLHCLPPTLGHCHAMPRGWLQLGPSSCNPMTLASSNYVLRQPESLLKTTNPVSSLVRKLTPFLSFHWTQE